MNSRQNNNFMRGNNPNQPGNFNPMINQQMQQPRQNVVNMPQQYMNPGPINGNYNPNQNYQNPSVNPMKYINPTQNNLYDRNQQFQNQNHQQMQMNVLPNQNSGNRISNPPGNNFAQNKFITNQIPGMNNQMFGMNNGINAMNNQIPGMNNAPRNNLNPMMNQNKSILLYKIDFQVVQKTEQLVSVNTTNETNFTNNCIIRNCNSAQKENIQNIVLEIKSEKINGQLPFEMSNCIALRLGRKEEDLKNKIPDYLLNTDFQIQALHIDDSKLSRCHCEIINYGNQLKIGELKTLNGTYRSLRNDEYAILNKDMVFFFLNVKFIVEGIYKNLLNNSFVIKIQITDEPEQFVNINSNECTSPQQIMLSNFSSNKEVKDIFQKIIDNCNLSNNLNNDNFPSIFFQEGIFYLCGVSVNEQSDVLLKLEPFANLTDKFLIDFQLNDKFNLGGETTIELKSINMPNENVNQQYNQEYNQQYNQEVQQNQCLRNCGNYSSYYFNCQHHFCEDCTNNLLKNGSCLCGNKINSCQPIQ